MDKINLAIREHFSFNQLKNTQNVIDWFNEIPNEIDRYILKSIIIYIYIYIYIYMYYFPKVSWLTAHVKLIRSREVVIPWVD